MNLLTLTMNYLRSGKYADEKGVHPSRITALRKNGKLRYKDSHGIILIECCSENDKLFTNPSHFRGRKKKEPL